MSSRSSSSRRQLTVLACVAAAVLLSTSSVTAFTVINPAATRFTASSPSVLFARKGGGRKRYAPRVQEEPKPPMNREINFQELRVVTASTTGGKDEPLGVMTKDEALAKAKALGNLDLILINHQSDPPVCKIADYSKYRYMKEKKAKEVKKNSKATEVKEVKMSYKIDIHDYEVRKKNANKFLNQGNRVKCTVLFRGREVQHDSLGFELLDKLTDDLELVALREAKPKREGRNLMCILSPRPEVLKARADKKRADEKRKKKERDESFQKLQESLEAGDMEKVAELQAAAAALEKAEAEQDDLLKSLAMDEDDDDDEDSVESSLDALLGSDDLTDDLFS
jgi:translation initiation factor IF-3